MKRLFLGITTLLALTFSVTSSALTLDYFTGLPGDSVYNDTGAQYVDLTDLTDPQSAPMITINTDIPTVTGKDYVVGIFDKDTRIELNVLDSHLGVLASNIIFGSFTAQSSLGTAFVGKTFGFFIRFYTDDSSGLISKEEYYSDDGAGDLFSVFHDPAGVGSALFAELALGITGTTPGAGTWKSLISVNDVAPTATPLPAAAWLFGSAMVGLLGLGRRRQIATGASA